MYKHLEINNIWIYVSLLLLTLHVPLQIGKCTPKGACTSGWEPLLYCTMATTPRIGISSLLILWWSVDDATFSVPACNWRYFALAVWLLTKVTLVPQRLSWFVLQIENQWNVLSKNACGRFSIKNLLCDFSYGLFSLVQAHLRIK